MTTNVPANDEVGQGEGEGGEWTGGGEVDDSEELSET